MYIGLHVRYRYSFQFLRKLEFSRQIVEKYSNIKFHENPSSGNRVVPCGETDRHTDMTKITVFHYFAKPPKKNAQTEYYVVESWKNT
jgi:hypothetical protein